MSSEVKIQNEEVKSHEALPELTPEMRSLVNAIKIANKDLGDKIDGLGNKIDGLGVSLGKKIDELSKVFILNVYSH